MTSWRGQGYLLHGVARRELIHRRTIVLGIALLLVASAGPVFGHHFTDAFSGWSSGRDHLAVICLVALQQLLTPVHDGFHLLLGLGLAYALLDRLRAIRLLRRTLSSLTWTSPRAGDPFSRAAALAGVNPSQVRLVQGLPAPAFTAGWFRPVIYIAAELRTRLSQRELAAVLAHEGAHVARHDPLRLSLVRFLARTLFWLPAVQQLAEDFGDEAEVEADDAAATLALPSGPLVLASALVTTAATFTMVTERTLDEHPGAGFCTSSPQSDLLGRRVRRLAGEIAPVRSHLTRGGIAVAVATLGLVWASSLAVAQSASIDEPASHCSHESGWAVAHLFCGRDHGAHDAPCMHDA